MKDQLVINNVNDKTNYANFGKISMIEGYPSIWIDVDDEDLMSSILINKDQAQQIINHLKEQFEL